VLTCRWRRNRQNTHGAEEREDEDENDELDDILLNDDDDVKMMQAGLLVPSERNEALPDSVRLGRKLETDYRTCWRQCINM